MYYPYFRGKQFELITIRENAELLAKNSIVPIIEPAKKSLSALERALKAIKEADGQLILIANPRCGDLVDDPSPIRSKIINGVLSDYKKYRVGYIVNSSSSDGDIDLIERESAEVSIIHDGYPHGRALAEKLKKAEGIKDHIFIEHQCSRLYRRHFPHKNRVLIRDGFTKRKNREHPRNEHFSDLHITYPDEGVQGFGDYLIVGYEYSDGGGPAYAVAIHLTFTDKDEESDMFLRHYKSDRHTTPVDPAGKFGEALAKLVADVDKPNSNIFPSNAVKEFRELHTKGHFPGLGYVKKLSMQHHVELIADFLVE